MNGLDLQLGKSPTVDGDTKRKGLCISQGKERAFLPSTLRTQEIPCSSVHIYALALPLFHSALTGIQVRLHWSDSAHIHSSQGLKRCRFLFDVKSKNKLRWACCVVSGSCQIEVQVWISFSKMYSILWVLVDIWSCSHWQTFLFVFQLQCSASSFPQMVERLELNKRIIMLFIKCEHAVLWSATSLNPHTHSAFTISNLSEV